MRASTLLLSITALVLILPLSLLAENVDPDGTGYHWAYSENGGWLDAEPGGDGGSAGLHTADGLITGWLWSPNVGWISAHCSNTSSCGDVEYGLHLEVDSDNPGWLRFSGKAWSENTGWVVSHCLETNSCNEVEYGLRVEMATGLVVGYAWSENLGWLSFSCSNTGSCGDSDFAIQFDPAALAPSDANMIFKDGFESGS
jgi:hypothetical protein